MQFLPNKPMVSSPMQKTLIHAFFDTPWRSISCGLLDPAGAEAFLVLDADARFPLSLGDDLRAVGRVDQELQRLLTACRVSIIPNDCGV